jgi:hypothetical protein
MNEDIILFGFDLTAFIGFYDILDVQVIAV